jgi:hypothetical protein
MDGECAPQRVLFYHSLSRDPWLIKGQRDLRLSALPKTLSEPELDWIVIHWFELSTLMLLCLNLWFISAVLSTLRETNRWLSFLSTYQWEQAQNSTPSKRR